MGACSSRSSGKKQNDEIENEINAEKRKNRDEVRLLLLGPGESGKSTVFKQMKLLSDGGLSRDELLGYKYVVFGNAITQMKVLVQSGDKLGIAVSSQNKERAERVAAVSSGGEAFTAELASDIQQLWEDPAVREIYSFRDKKYQLNDSAEYFFNNMNRFIDPEYVPTEMDVLRARVRSTGIEEAEFTFEKVRFRVVDVGGQRSERRKWIHYFEAVTAVIFCVALSEYDQTLREEDSTNRMHESLNLFDEICNNPFFRNVTMILFLNKTDLFKEKIQKTDLNVCFQNYTGGCNFDRAVAFIKLRFHEQNQSPHHAIYTHFTCAINRENMEFVFKCIREAILKKILNEVILY